MKSILIFSLFSASFSLFSAELDCSIQINQEIMSSTQVSTTLDQKINIDSLEGVYAYVTEKQAGHFILEAYLVDYDLRIYGEGSLKQSEDKVVASAWGRTSMVDIECRLKSNSSLRKH